MNLLRVCEGKVTIDLTGTDLTSIYSRSFYSKLLEYSKAEDIEAEDKEYLFELQKTKLNLLLSFLLSQNENLLAAKHPTLNLTLGQIAQRNNDSKLLELLLSLNSEVFKRQMGEVDPEKRASLST